MTSQYITMAGLVFDLIGAFLVSVEAIKIENLRRLRERYLLPMHTHVRHKKLLFKGKGIYLEDGRPFRFFTVGLLLHLLAGALTMRLIVAVVAHYWPGILDTSLTWLVRLPWYGKTPIIVFIVLLLIPVLFDIGEFWHKALVRGTRIPILALETIEARTASGVIGIIGFSFLAVGFSSQFLGVWLSKSPP